MDTLSRTSPHIAVVDDDADVRSAMHALLRSYGWRVSLYDGARQLLATGVGGVAVGAQQAAEGNPHRVVVVDDGDIAKLWFRIRH